MHINGTANYRVGFMFFEVFPGGGGAKILLSTHPTEGQLLLFVRLS